MSRVWWQLSATELAQAIRIGETTAVAVLASHLERIAAVNPSLNAIVYAMAESALERARQADLDLARGKLWGPLHGVPFTIKDNIEVAGVPCTNATLGRAHAIPSQDATIVSRIKAAGGIPLGKTNMPELGLAYESDNLVYGRTNNPFNPAYTAGGSSGGEGAIIAVGGSPLGLGNDAGGSIRVPAHYCGIAGIKPTHGRVAKTGGWPVAGGPLHSLAQHGPMARTVEDLILALALMSGEDGHDPFVVPAPWRNPYEVDTRQLRLAFYTDNGLMPCTPNTVAAVLNAVNVLDQADIPLTEARPKVINQTYDLFNQLFMADGGIGTTNLLRHIGTTETHHLLTELQAVRQQNPLSTSEFFGLAYQWDMFRWQMMAFMQQYDAIICPVTATPALLHGTSFDPEYTLTYTYTATYNLTGWPAAVVRAGTSPEGLPIGVQIVARPWREDVALALALQLQHALPSFPRPWP